ncbi:unnamed protein product [Boreogadus saida]
MAPEDHVQEGRRAVHRQPQCLNYKDQSAEDQPPQSLSSLMEMLAGRQFIFSPDEASVFEKMKLTLQQRQDLSCCSIDEHLRGRKGQQPYILAAGHTQNKIDTFYIVVDKQFIPCQATSSLGAFDELFKSHYVLNLSYEESLVQLYTFLQTTVYNIDVTTDESQRIRELRAKLLN